MARWILSVLLLGAVIRPANATIVALCGGPERGHILTAINGAKRTIDLRVQTLSDPEIVRALKGASGRHVMVRIVVDELSPALIRAIQNRTVEFETRVLAPKHRGLFLAPSQSDWTWRMFDEVSHSFGAKARSYLHRHAPEATLQVDATLTWYGVSSWDDNHWVGISTEIIGRPAPPEGAPRFVQAWQAALSPPY